MGTRPMRRPRGWTLIELLVVIAIVAVLLSIALPALHRARLQARTVICLSRLRQLGNATMAWADGNGGTTFPYGGQWQVALRLHTPEKRNEILFCPRAERLASEGAQAPFAAYNAFSFGDSFGIAQPEESSGTLSTPYVYNGYGSYGLNGWVSNPASDTPANGCGFPTADHWRRMAVRGAATVPLLADADWIEGFPHHTDRPRICEVGVPEVPPADPGQMRVFCLNRHDGYINTVFLDLAARKVGLKELWRLKWHRRYDVDAPAPAWPEWMKKYKDY